MVVLMVARKSNPDLWLGRRIARDGPFLALCVTEEQYLQAMDDLGVKYLNEFVTPGANATVHHDTNKDGKRACVVCISVTDQSPIEIAGLLVHEAVHVWQEHCADMGEKSPASEQMAYGIQAIAQELMAAYARGLK